MRKRFPALTFLLSLLLCAMVRAAEPRLEVRLPAAPVEAGQEFAVTVDLTGNPGILNIQFTLAFDKELMECTEAKVGALLEEQADASATNPEAKSGAIIASVSTDAITGDGQVGVFQFRAKEKVSDFRFSVEKITLSDRNKNKLDVVVTNAASGGTGAGESPAPAASGNGTGASDNSANHGSGTSPALSNSGTDATDSGSGASVAPANQGGGTSPADGGKPAGADDGASLPNGTGASPANQESADAPTFSDIAGFWAEEYIRTAAARNIFQGYADGTFRPDNRLTRAQFMTALWNLAGRPEPPQESPFEDMPGQIENFRKAVAWAYAKGYVNGTSAATFSPGEPLTRQAAVKILFAYNGSMSGAEALLTAVYDAQYADSGKISAWAKPAMYWAVYQKILSGTSPTTLNPGGTVTRAQIAAIMVRYTDRFPA
ncbi:MAG: S-layer homology domain-containing protein [Oscillibacter sp.]|nr:S-layer homology domain-containing protein [Oscillibacter sp.]